VAALCIANKIIHEENRGEEGDGFTGDPLIYFSSIQVFFEINKIFKVNSNPFSPGEALLDVY
jgi:hypothetical protein